MFKNVETGEDVGLRWKNWECEVVEEEMEEVTSKNGENLSKAPDTAHASSERHRCSV